MKYVIILGDGMADEPIESLGGKTPLQAAHKPVMDEMAKKAEQGIAYTVPDNLPAGSDVANLSCWDMIRRNIIRTFPAGGPEHRCGYERYRCGVKMQHCHLGRRRGV